MPISIRPEPTTLTVIETFGFIFPGFGGYPIKAWLMLPRHRVGRLPLVEYIGYRGGRGHANEHLHWATRAAKAAKRHTRWPG